MNLDGEFSRKKLSKFLVQELLYEYVTHNLNFEREKEVTDYLETCRESQRELENLSKGLRYCQIAEQVKISASLHEALENFEPQWKKRLRVWTLWSSERGWKLLPYIFVISALGLGLYLTKPWQMKPSDDVMLAEALRKEPDMNPKPPAPPAAATPSPVPVPVPSPIAATAPTAPTPAAPAPSPAPLPEIKGLSQAQAPKPSPAAVPEETQKTESANEEQMGRGYLYRAEFSVNDFMNSWPAIRDKIVALGGKVAGNVELGWLRRPTESYFHFSLPESNLNELEIFLGTFSPVRFSKERHPRVMPEGQIRIIMTVKDGMTQHEAPPASP